jgi:tyrosinase
MKALPARDPSSWTFQWYTHAVRGDRTEAQELQAAFGSTPSATRSLAERVWSTCQAHPTSGAAINSLFFLPWHRMYLHYFERICRRVLGDETFTIPYWDYVNGSKALPAPFRDRASPLYYANRRAESNRGDPIDAGSPRPLNHAEALAVPNFGPSGPDLAGFTGTVERMPHNSVHGMIGDELRGMGTVPWAAADPIFWLHHCNIDRLWASWNALGRRNPSDRAWLDASFTFADENGREVNPRNRDFADQAALGIRYDRLEPAPRPGAGEAAENDDARLGRSPTMSSRHRAAPSGGIALGAQAIQVTLPRERDGTRESGESEEADAGQRGRVFLQLRNFRADAPPGVLYHVYLSLPEGARGRDATRHYVGPLSFFDAVPGRAHAQHFRGKSTSFDVTDIVRRLRREGLFSGTPSVTIAPAGAPPEAARPLIGEIRLVQA